MSASAVPATKERVEVVWGERRTIADLHRTNRRVLRIDVQPSGHVVVFAPSDGDLEKIRERVKRKGAWIFRELDRIAAWPARTPVRQYLSGETHLFLGKQYRLAVDQADEPRVFVEGARLNILAANTEDKACCAGLLRAFYTAMARHVFHERLDAVSPPFIRKGMQKPSLIIRVMSKRWGSFTAAGRIVLNVDLVRASPLLIDYVICHELSHAFFPDHGKGWRDLLSMVMPDWEDRKARLESFLR
jgi:predicted metal-dependent hydrolase